MNLLIRYAFCESPVMTAGLKHIQDYQRMLEGNRKYVDGKLRIDPEFFNKLSKGQEPKYLLIGCSDSRAPPNELTGTEPGEIFIHRNIANCVIPTDLSMNCVLQYAVENLKIRNIIVMGHTYCGGVKAAMSKESLGGCLDLWLNNIKLTYEKHNEVINSHKEENDQLTSLCKFHIREQVLNLWKNPIIQKSWSQGIPIIIHGWLLKVDSGYIDELYIDETVPKDMPSIFQYTFNDQQLNKHNELNRIQLQIIERWKTQANKNI